MEKPDVAAALLEFLKPHVDAEIHVGPWFDIDQERIDRFADITEDRQWIHIDPVRARAESAYGSTVAHGYLTLSLLPFLTQQNQQEHFSRNYPGMRYRVNYGLNKVRFPAPVRPGDRIRARTTLLRSERAGDGVEICYLITVEREGGDKPACVAESVVRVFP